MSTTFGVRMTGLPEMGGRLAEFRNKAPGVVENISYKAAQLVADEARPSVPVGDTGRAARSVQAYMTGGQSITQGGEGIDYYSWLERGGASGRNLSNQRPIVTEGRYIYPAYQRSQQRIRDLMEAELASLASTVFR